MSTEPALRRYGLAAAALVAPWGLMLCNLGYALATRDGGSDATGADSLALAAAEPSTLRFTVLSGLIGALLMVPAALAAARVAAAGAARLAFVAGTLTAAGYACYQAVLMPDLVTLAMAERGGPVADYAAVIDAFQEHSGAAWVFLLFVLGNIVGTFLLGLALYRSRAVPRWAALAVLAWPPLHIAGLAAGLEWFEVGGAALQGAGLAAVAVRLLRREPLNPAVSAPASAAPAR